MSLSNNSPFQVRLGSFSIALSPPLFPLKCLSACRTSSDSSPSGLCGVKAGRYINTIQFRSIGHAAGHHARPARSSGTFGGCAGSLGSRPERLFYGRCCGHTLAGTWSGRLLGSCARMPLFRILSSAVGQPMAQAGCCTVDGVPLCF